MNQFLDDLWNLYHLQMAESKTINAIYVAADNKWTLPFQQEPVNECRMLQVIKTQSEKYLQRNSDDY